MASEQYWRLRCLTENKYVYGWLDSAPTTCFNNPTHSVKASSVVSLKRDNWVKLGEAVSKLDVLCLSDDKKYYKALASNGNRLPGACFALTNGVENDHVPTQASGVLSGFSGLTNGARYYVSHITAGAITTVNPQYAANKSQAVGQAYSSSKLTINFQSVEVAANLPQIQWSSNNAGSKNSTWTKLGSTIFPGYSICKTPIYCRFIAWAEGAITGSFRIFDSTHNKVICEYAGITGSIPLVYLINSINNIPEDAAVWEIQVKRTSGSPSQSVYADCVQFG